MGIARDGIRSISGIADAMEGAAGAHAAGIPALDAERAPGTLPSVGTGPFRHKGGHVSPDSLE